MGRCLQCKHYHVTWDKRFPHGCKAMGFKSESPPSLLVEKISMMKCQYFSKKKTEDKQQSR